MTTKKAAAKVASKPEPKPTVDVAACCADWHRAQLHIDTIDAQAGPGSPLTPADVERLQAERAGHVAAQEAAEKALAG